MIATADGGIGRGMITRRQFRALFVLGPLLFSSLIPSLIFGVLADQWGSNVIWGSVFGLGWCLSAFASGSLVHDGFSTTVGLIWGWFVLVPLYFGSGWLWDRLSDRGRKFAVMALLLSFLVIVPAKTLMRWEELGIHLPDYTLHLASSY